MVTTLMLVLGVQLSAVPAFSVSAVAMQNGQQPQSDPGKTSEEKVFTGRVMQSDGQYVLKNRSTHVTYALDGQEQAKQSEGKAVGVTGTLESSSNLIHVSNIEPVA